MRCRRFLIFHKLSLGSVIDINACENIMNETDLVYFVKKKWRLYVYVISKKNVYIQLYDPVSRH